MAKKEKQTNDHVIDEPMKVTRDARGHRDLEALAKVQLQKLQTDGEASIDEKVRDVSCEGDVVTASLNKGSITFRVVD